MSDTEEKGYKEYHEGHRERAVDEIIDYEASAAGFKTDANKKQSAAKEVDYKVTSKPKKKHSVVLSAQGLLLIYFLVIEFLSTFQSVSSISESPYWMVVFIGQVVLLVAIATLLYFYFDGYKRNDNFFLIPIVSYIIYECTLIYTNAGSRIGPMYPWMNVLVGLSIVLCILSLIKINKFYFVVVCWIIAFLFAIIVSLPTIITVTIPYIGENGVNAFTAITYISMNISPAIMCFSVLVAYIENTKRKATVKEGSKWIKRGDGKYWKFG